MIGGFHHVVLFCKDTEVSKDWYERVGFVYKHGYEEMHWFALGDGQIMLHPGGPGAEAGADGRPVLHAAVAELDALFRHVKEQGLEPVDHQSPGVVLKAPVVRPWGAKEFELQIRTANGGPLPRSNRNVKSEPAIVRPALLRPPILRSGDTVALISPASPFYRGEFSAQELLEQVRARLDGLGLRTVIGSHAADSYGYLAGRDDDRARDLMAAFADPDVNAILCMGGGYGTPRILDLLDYELIARHPKLFIGYSDVTALHTAIGQRAGLVTFHGPMGFELARIQRTLIGTTQDEGSSAGETIPDATTDMRANEVNSKTASARQTDAAATAFTWEWFVRALMHPDALGELPTRVPWQSRPLRCIVPGMARGPLVGGNLSLLADTLGTPYEIDTSDKILLIEEIGEAPYRIDRMLTQLRLAGKLQAAAGFIVAEWTDCKPTPARPSLTLDQVLTDIIEPLGKPTVYGLAAGHGPGRLTLPFGVPVTIDADRSSVAVTEAGVNP